MSASDPNPAATPDETPSAADIRVLLEPWPAPDHAPPFDRVRTAALEPAIEQAMAEQLAQIEAIAADPRAPTFDNTIAALERAGARMRRVMAVYGVWTGNLSSPRVRALERSIAPRLAAFRDRIVQNARLFSRIDAVHAGLDEAELTPEQRQLTRLRWVGAVKRGARLEAGPKARLAQINAELAGLYTQFSQNLLADETGYVHFLSAEDLDGLPAASRDAAAAAAADHGRPGEYAILNTRSAVEPFLTYSDRRDLREKVWRTFYGRGENGDANDNTLSVIPDILRLRAEKARLLGFETYAAWKLQDQMARSPETAMALMRRVWPAVAARIAEEVADMQALADAEAGGRAAPIAAWDYRHYADKVRRAKFDFDMNQVKAYLQLDRIKDAMFWAAGQLWGLNFARTDRPGVFHREVEVYAVTDGQGADLGLWYFDPYARPGKRSGAWMVAYRPQQTLDGAAPAVVSNNANFVRAAPGQPTLISWEDAVTLFHEFGHAVHGLSSKVTYPSLASPSQAQDFIELPSQLFENWLSTREVLSRFAVDVEGRPIPDELVAKIRHAGAFNQGFAAGEYLSAAIVDMALHTTDPASVGDIAGFERAALAELGMPPQIAMRHRLPQFQHIFAGDDYAAGYYSYMWAEVLDRDAFEAFTEATGPFDRAVAQRLMETVLKVGHSVEPDAAFRAFRGRDPDIAAFNRAKGFATAAR